MKPALIICPTEHLTVQALSESGPLAALPLFGKPLLAHWIEHLAAAGALEIWVRGAEINDHLSALIGSGERWGVQIRMMENPGKPDSAPPREPFQESTLLEPSGPIVCAEAFPCARNKLFESYAGFFASLLEWMPCAAANGRAGLREIEPGIWAGLRTRDRKSTRLNSSH